MITHQSSCEFSAAVTQRRERGDKPEGVGICWAVLTAPFLSFPVLSASLSLLPSLSTEQPNRCRLFSGEGGAEKNLSLSLSLVQPFFSPPIHSFSLSLLPSCALLVSHPPSPYIFFHCPTSSALCISLSEFVCVCVLI